MEIYILWAVVGFVVGRLSSLPSKTIEQKNKEAFYNQIYSALIISSIVLLVMMAANKLNKNWFKKYFNTNE